MRPGRWIAAALAALAWAMTAVINEANPRALYFNDSVSVGWVRGGFIEIASQDPTQGTMFYTAGASSDAISDKRRRFVPFWRFVSSRVRSPK